ncbi:50S ribosomal protein L3 N(5)-glutamine methyltransferase [Methyloglobulus morosus]|uniref:50S ribosomal protein L3 N(5)-glutamine methyltransferase n=1 Tax=Methyloglobulus morosus TaxID=1410681 RepID=UPI000427193F|nr:50S ribosomal protein L3 N(5)-glutamine methyltransferase [Methyloglobulus morosus]
MNSQSPDVLSSLTTLRDYIRWGASRFVEAKLVFGHGTASALDEAAALVLHVLRLPYNLSEFYLQSALTLEERQAIVAIIERRISERKPAAYLTHESIFAGLSFYVDERVLVPRSPIAELIEQRFAPWVEEEQVERILDLCTGSGCIAIACGYAFPGAEVDAVDVSSDALAVAEINVDKHASIDNVLLYQSDLFDQLPDERYDIIVSNPPYVAIEEWQQLPAEFHAEPEIGFVAGDSGLDLVIRILAEAKDYLTPQGILVVEVGSSAETLQETFPNVPFYWLDFERGGDGVFLLTAEQVNEYHEQFTSALD